MQISELPEAADNYNAWMTNKSTCKGNSCDDELIVALLLFGSSKK